MNRLSPEAIDRAESMGFRLGKNAASSHSLAVTNVGNLWSPDIWIRAAAEPVVGRLMLLNSGIVATSPALTEVATGGGTKANLPRFREPNVADEIQVASTGPTKNNITASTMVAPILNRVLALGTDALAGAVSDSDPIGYIGQVIGINRLRNREVTLLSTLRGFFHTAAAANSEDNFVEVVGNQTASHLIDSIMINKAVAALGENVATLTQGAMVVHSTIHQALLNQDSIEFIRDSQGVIVMQTYKGIPLFINDLLVRDGTTSGKVFESYVFARGSVGFGEKPQSNVIGDVASLTRDEDAHTNDVVLYDRTRVVMHPSGGIWGGTPSGNSATNAELATGGNWTLAGDIRNTGIVRIRTNG
jgi:hypothetical protein